MRAAERMPALVDASRPVFLMIFSRFERFEQPGAAEGAVASLDADDPEGRRGKMRQAVSVTREGDFGFVERSDFRVPGSQAVVSPFLV